jgi:uncharacterized protein YkwD
LLSFLGVSMLKRFLIFPLLVIATACGDFYEKDEKKEEKKEEPAPAPAPTPAPEKPGNPFPFPLPFPLPPGLPIPDLPDIPIPGMPGGGMPGDNQTPPSEDTLQGLADAINSARKSRGLSEVKVELQLNCAAKRHADDIGVKKICGHTGSDGSSPWDRARDCGTSADGEIVACGQGSPKAAVDAWTMSPGHAAIMYAPNQTVIGVGMLNNFWVAIFR